MVVMAYNAGALRRGNSKLQPAYCVRPCVKHIVVRGTVNLVNFKFIIMLQKNEVRIGNDVLYMDTDTPEFVPIKIDKADIMLLCEGMQGYNYKGIPLTPELFEKNLGLVKVRGTSDEYKIGNLTFNLCLYEQGYKVNIYLGGEFLGYHTVFHTIQNLLYSLTGVELKVTW